MTLLLTQPPASRRRGPARKPPGDPSTARRFHTPGLQEPKRPLGIWPHHTWGPKRANSQPTAGKSAVIRHTRPGRVWVTSQPERARKAGLGTMGAPPFPAVSSGSRCLCKGHLLGTAEGCSPERRSHDTCVLMMTAPNTGASALSPALPTDFLGLSWCYGRRAGESCNPRPIPQTRKHGPGRRDSSSRPHGSVRGLEFHP